MSTSSLYTPDATNPGSDPPDLNCSLSLRRVLFNYGMNAIAFGLAGLALLPLLAILYKILATGVPAFKWEMLVSLPAPAGATGVANGFANAILGTILMVSLAALVSVPTGVMTAVLLVEVKSDAVVASLIRFITKVLSGVPSIVVGVFAYGVIVLMTHSFSAIAGAFALAVIMLPIIVLTAEEALKSVPMSQRLASAALGGSRLQTTWRIVLTSALPGITTGILLAIARAAGETAPLLFTALFSQSWIEGPTSPTPSLSVLIFNYYNEPDPARSQLAWTASLVLVALVLITSVLSRLITRNRLKIR
jgi:phosphate transport system permease protein